MISPKFLARLKTDYERAKDLVTRTPFITFECPEKTDDMPPDLYIVTFTCRGITGKDEEENPIYGELHKVSIQMKNSNYPSSPPLLTGLTPMYHPDWRNERICIFKWRSGFMLDELLIMLAETMTFRHYTLHEYEGGFVDGLCSKWVKESVDKGSFPIPVDNRPLFYPEKTGNNQKIRVISETSVPSRIKVIPKGENNERKIKILSKQTGKSKIRVIAR